MKIYLAHASGYDYESELYEPLRKTIAKEHDVFFPHDEQNAGKVSKEIIASSDFVIAEVSRPSTGQGIELGWADDYEIPVLCVYRSGSTPSSTLRVISDMIVEYKSAEELPEVVANQLKSRGQG
ncbi:MAG TPA: hypothetical protein VGE34_02930 [Candidatus Saccharimonadales bacterium]